MGQSHSVPSNEISSYLSQFDERLASKLSKQGPDVASLLETGISCGTDDVAHIDPAILKAQCKILGPALQSAMRQSEQVSALLQARLENLRRLRLGSSVCTAVGALVAAGASFYGEMATTAAASIVTFIGAVANAVAGQYMLGADGTETEIFVIIQKLEGTRAFADLASKYLQAAAADEYPVTQVAPLIADANAHFATLVGALTNSARYVRLRDQQLIAPTAISPAMN